MAIEHIAMWCPNGPKILGEKLAVLTVKGKIELVAKDGKVAKWIIGEAIDCACQHKCKHKIKFCWLDGPVILPL